MSTQTMFSMKNISAKKIAPIAIALTFIVGGCSLETIASTTSSGREISSERSNQVLVSSDRKSQITLPLGWQPEESLNALATLQASKRWNELYVIAHSFDKENFADIGLQEYSDLFVELFQENLMNPEVSGPTEVTTINGYPAVQHEVRGTVNNLNIVYLHTIIETPENFHEVVAWTSPSRFDDYRAELQQVVQSFQEVPVAASTQSSTQSSTQPSTQFSTQIE